MSHYPSLAKNYGVTPFDAVRGEGVYLYDAEGKRYLDFTSGIAVNALGHSHPHWISAIQKQSAELVHCSNLYGVPGQKQLADRLLKRTGPGRILFCNSGAESTKRSSSWPATRTSQLDATKPCAMALYARITPFMAGPLAEWRQPRRKDSGWFSSMLEGFKFAELKTLKVLLRQSMRRLRPSS